MMTKEIALSMSRFMTNYESSVTQLAKSTEAKKMVPETLAGEKELRHYFSDYLEI